MGDSTYSEIVQMMIQASVAAAGLAWAIMRSSLGRVLKLRHEIGVQLLESNLHGVDITDVPVVDALIMRYWITFAATLGGFDRPTTIGKLAGHVAFEYASCPDPLVPGWRRAWRAGRGAMTLAIVEKCHEEPYRLLDVALRAAGTCFAVVTLAYSAGFLMALTFPAEGVRPANLAIAAVGNMFTAALTLATARLFRAQRPRAGRIGLAIMGSAMLGTVIVHDGWPALPGLWSTAIWVSLTVGGAGVLAWSILASTRLISSCCVAARMAGYALTAVALLTAADGLFGYAGGSLGNAYNAIGALGWLIMGRGAVAIGKLGSLGSGIGARDADLRPDEDPPAADPPEPEPT